MEKTDDVKMLNSMIAATGNLIKASNKSDEEESFNIIASNTMGLNKITEPLNLEGFKWLASTVDNIIVMVNDSEETDAKNEMVEDAVKLKEVFFKYATFRLSGGIDAMWTDDSYVSDTVKTDSFVISFTKLSVPNIRDYK